MHLGRRALAAWSCACLTACAATVPAPATAPTPAAAAAAASTSQNPTLKTPLGRTIQFVDTGEVDSYETVSVAMEAVAKVTGDAFGGTARKAAKLSIVSAATETFDSVQELVDTLEADDDMRQRQPRISDAATSRRVAEERRNVSVKSLLVAASREEDNDFHLIVCDSPSSARDEQYCFNVEVSGLPSSGTYRTRLTTARNQFKALVGNQLPGSRYVTYSPPIPVAVTGSLFYDISHPPGQVGPKSFKPLTAWEIHPITAIVER